MLNIISAPQVLTDAIFLKYGGSVENLSQGQLQAAYAIAEAQAAEEIGTYIGPTRVTGTYSWPPMGEVLQLEKNRIIGIVGVTAILEAGCDCANDAIELSGCAWIKEAGAGIIDVRQCGNTLRANCAGCYARYGQPYQVRVVFDAGLPTGTWGDPRLLMALTTAAKIALDQMLDPESGEGGAGEPGVKSFRSLSYSETRSEASYRMTAFGNSARANYAAGLLRSFRYHSPGKLGW